MIELFILFLIAMMIFSVGFFLGCEEHSKACKKILERLFVTEVHEKSVKWLLSFDIPDAWNPNPSIEVSEELAKDILRLQAGQGILTD